MKDGTISGHYILDEPYEVGSWKGTIPPYCFEISPEHAAEWYQGWRGKLRRLLLRLSGHRLYARAVPVRYVRGIVALLFALLAPALLLAQEVRTTPDGDTVYRYSSERTDSLVIKRVVIRTVRDTLRDTVPVPVYLPAPAPEPPRIDTAWVASPYPLGKPIGPFSICTSYTGYASGMPGPFGATLCATGPSGIVQQLQTARAAKVKLILAMTGGAHDQYITNGKFDYAKWKTKQAAYCTTAIKASVDSAVKDGTLIGNSILDEPEHPSWGGVLTHALLDSMSRYVKSCFPTLPTATVVPWDWQKTQRYSSLDFIISQYSYKKQYGDVLAYRDSAIVSAKRQGVALAFSMNVLDGGTQPVDYAKAMTDLAYWQSQCTYGTGTLRPNCRMSPAQILDGSKVFLGSSACLLTMWRFDDSFFRNAENLAAFKEAATYAARQPAPPCKRP